jgi:hypothetical protein
VKARASPSLDTFISAAQAHSIVHGAGSATLNSFTCSAAAKVIVKASGSPELDAFTVTSAIGASPARLTGSPTLDTFISADAARVLVEGAGSGVLNAFGSAAAVRVRITGSAVIDLEPFVGTATARHHFTPGPVPAARIGRVNHDRRTIAVAAGSRVCAVAGYVRRGMADGPSRIATVYRQGRVG